MVAVGLAANILQFISVGSKLVSTVWSIPMSGRQGLAGLLDVQKITEDLKNVLGDFRTPNNMNPSPDSYDNGLQQLVKNCEHLASELLESLQKIVLPDKSRKRDNLRAALRMVWKEEDLKSLQSTLDSYRQELVLHLLTVIR